MYRVFLVDDRLDVLEGIRSLIDWNSLECEVAGWAANGKDAFERIETDRPDIIITDIKMPVMDGLQLIELCRERYRNIRFVVLSGYDDFSYAQKAIRLGVDEYILKPAGVTEITETLGRIIMNLKREERRLSQLGLSLPLLKQEYFRYLVTSSDMLSMEEIAERFLFLEMEMFNGEILLVMLEPGSGGDRDNHWITDITQAMVKMVSPFYHYECFVYGGEALAAVIEGKGEQKLSAGQAFIILTELKEELERNGGLTVTVAMSEVFKNISFLKPAFWQARQAQSYKMYQGSKVISYEEIKELPVQNHVEYMQITDGLIHAVRIGEVVSLEKLAEEFFERNRHVMPQQMKDAVKDIVTIVCHYSVQGGFAGNVPEEWRLKWQSLKTDSELKSWMIQLLCLISDGLMEHRQGQAGQYVEQAKYVIEHHFADNITLAAASELIGLTPAYLSCVFKEQTGQTFTDYLVGVRMKRAKELLKTGGFKIYEVAEKVGYTDFRYFGEQFKKKTGLTPREFMNQK